MKTVRYILIYLLAAFCGLPLSVKAQDNPYKIDNSLYLLYERATKYRNEPEGLLIADTLYTNAIRKNDKKAQCLALTIPVIYYFNTRETEQLEKAITTLQEVSRKNDYLQYYYFGSIYKVNHQMNINSTLRALQEAELIKEQAFADNYPYGIATCLRMMGNIYYARRETRTALDYYQQALEYSQKNLPEQDLAYIYWNISMLQQGLNQYETAYENAEKGIKCAKTQTNLYACMLRKCTLLYVLDRTEEFKSYYQECLKMTEKYGQTRKNELQALRIYNYVLHGQYEKAHAIADSVDLPQDRMSYHADIYSKENKYKEAFYTFKELQHLQDSLGQLIQSADLSELNVRIGNEQLKRKAQQGESDRQLMILKFILIFFCFFATALIFYLYLRRKSIRKLQEKNEELTIARNHAEQADKMKTYFIQNMSHEIRTPLNAIVGFSQLLSDPNLPLDDEEKQEFSSLVLHNSELLTTLVNDILDLSALESGKYAMNLAPHACNEMCRMILSTVTHRKPEEVELCYTSDVPDDFRIVTDEQRMQQVLINFLTNAEKHTEKGKIHLHCSITENPGKITFSVTDTGRGIPADKMDSVFERFKKLDEFKQGSGLGLNICRIIAERLNGEVKIDKNYTGGARFLFILPLQ